MIIFKSKAKYLLFVKYRQKLVTSFLKKGDHTPQLLVDIL